MSATAISNNDMVYLHWHVPDKIPKCLGFTVIRHEVGRKAGPGTALPAMVGFPGDKAAAGKEFDDTDRWPIQKYAWKDLFARRGGSYWYEIIPMVGTPGKLIRDTSMAMRTKSVSLDSNRGTCSVFFNRGIISTQAIAHSLSTKNGVPSAAFSKKRSKTQPVKSASVLWAICRTAS